LAWRFLIENVVEEALEGVAVGDGGFSELGLGGHGLGQPALRLGDTLTIGHHTLDQLAAEWVEGLALVDELLLEHGSRHVLLGLQAKACQQVALALCSKAKLETPDVLGERGTHDVGRIRTSDLQTKTRCMTPH